MTLLTEFFFWKFFLKNFFEEFSKFYVGMNCKDWKNDLVELDIGKKGFWANVLPTDQPTDRHTEGHSELLCSQWCELMEMLIHEFFARLYHSLHHSPKSRSLNWWGNFIDLKRPSNIGFSSFPWQSDLLANQLNSLEVFIDARSCPIPRYVFLIWVLPCKIGWNRAVFALFFLSRLCHTSLYQVYQPAECLSLWKNLSLVSQGNQLTHTSWIEQW